jgi:outer membrane protein OmpA-like peptidoglycan-associated protein
MSITQRFVILSCAGALAVGTTACTTNPETGHSRISKTGIGAIAGAALGAGGGALIGGKRNRTETIVGAGIGALAGAAVGRYMDQQEQKLRQQTAGTGIEVERQGDEIKLNLPSGVTFDTESAALKPEFRTQLAQVASTLSQYEKTYVDVVGHTDSTGSDQHNQLLSERRAGSVADYLASQGVARARLATQGLGETQPVASNDTAEGRAQNRRVEIRLVPFTEKDQPQTS